jgi:hypothetical protein
MIPSFEKVQAGDFVFVCEKTTSVVVTFWHFWNVSRVCRSADCACLCSFLA